MNKPIIAIVAGGYSGEYAVSLRSASGILSWIDTAYFTPYVYVIERDHWYVEVRGQKLPIDRATFGFELEGKTIIPNFAYITIHGTPGENGILQGYLDLLGISYNTGGVLTEALTFNKYVCNRYLSTQTGIRVARSYRLLGTETSHEIIQMGETLAYPLFVKPNTGGSSVATSRVEDASQLISAVQTAFAESSEVMIEGLIQGTEVTCGAYELAGSLHILPITEVVAHNSFFDFDAKYNGQVEEITPARIPEDEAEQVRSLTRSIYGHVHARGIIRVDYIIESDGTPTLLEVNTTPGMTPTSFIPQQIAAAGLEIKDVLTALIQEQLKSS